MRDRSNPRDVLTAIRAERIFAGRVRAARAILGKPLGAGSGRVVFDLGDGTVLKIAKNYSRNRAKYWGATSASLVETS